MERIALYNDSFQNWKSHDILKAQLILTDIPYQLGTNMYGSNPIIPQHKAHYKKVHVYRKRKNNEIL